MKYKLIEKVPIPIPRHKNKKDIGEKIIVKAQTEKEYLILDLFRYKRYISRYVLNTETGEHAGRYEQGDWNTQKLIRIMGYDPLYESFYNSRILEKVQWDTKEDIETVKNAVQTVYSDKYLLSKIESMEEDYGKEKRLRSLDNKYRKIDRLMEGITDNDEEFKEWLYKICSTERYLFWNKGNNTYGCSNCGSQILEKNLDKPRQGETRKCPECGQPAVVKKRTQRIWSKTRACKLERITPEYGVARHYRAEIKHCINGHRVFLEEDVRILLYNKGHVRPNYMIFYNQDGETYEWSNGLTRSDWYTSNPQNKRMEDCFLYPKGIPEALKGTEYESVTNAFVEMARLGLMLNYNSLMAAGCRLHKLGTMMEYLAKGRFYRLCKETARSCWAYNGSYSGPLSVNGNSIEEVMGLTDKQKINRLRDENGGCIRLEWLKYAEAYGCKIPKNTMDYLEENRIATKEIEELPDEITDRMSIEQIVNYIRKQAGKHYGTPQRALSQWVDYLFMRKAQNKNLNDELFYKPKDLKQRHDELITDKKKLDTVRRMSENPELRQQEARIMEEKFPGTTEVMKEVKEKYEFAAEGYRMIMPENPVEIVREGYALHHCAGSSERYFNRIENRETFIGFLRREQEPGIPFYTIEFEPGGTIRQNRSYYDEEPGIEEIRGFLKLWQKEIKKRLTKEDKKHAAKSAILREQNIKELQKNQNTFVLKKLEEDFMEAI